MSNTEMWLAEMRSRKRSKRVQIEQRAGVRGGKECRVRGGDFVAKRRRRLVLVGPLDL